MSDRKTGWSMDTAQRYFNAGFMGLMAGYSLALALSRSVWLEMRFTVGHILPLSIVVFVVLCKYRKRPLRLAFLPSTEVLALFLPLMLYGVTSSTVLVIPAALFRDGFHLSALSLSTVNYLLLLILGAGNGLAIRASLTARDGSRNG